ncbi:DUF362 domain-containing protein [Candidatus Thorarchaeota archaeon]|nr:MAG: DUF362 domain-containing protein [Candidatus Thorarchaeota archaeon]
MTRVTIVDIGESLQAAIAKAFKDTIEARRLIKSSGEVYIKPNGIDFQPYAFTDPRVLEFLINHLKEEGAEEIYLMENSTQANMTRIVYEFTGYKDVCNRTGANPLYLDEMDTKEVTLDNFEDPIEFPTVVVEKLIEESEDHTYISVPKLKTHSMTTVTLGVKNQMGFPRHKDRGYHHNYNLHRRLADFYRLVQPDYTLIDGTHVVFNGHYPLQTFVSESIEELGILVAGRDTLATDVVASRILGYDLEEVKHLKLVYEDGLGEGKLDEIEVIGNLERFNKKYPCDILDQMPEDVRIIRGREKLCAEGCDLNVRMLLQLLYYDYDGKGGFSIVMGKGFDKKELESIDEQVLIAGDCAIKETQQFLENKLGRENVFVSPTCNRLAATTTALCKLMGVSPLDMVPSKRKALKALLLAKLRGSRALIPDIL